MSNAIEFVTFKLKKGICADEFIVISDKFNDKFLKKQKGFISRKVLTNGDIWADLVLWETAADHLNSMDASKNDAVAKEYLSTLNLSAKGSSYHLLSEFKDYG